MPQIVGPILDSTGHVASGFITATMSRAFDIPTGLVTTATARIQVRRGTPMSAGSDSWILPVTPEGVVLHLEQDLDGDKTQKHVVIVPDVPTLTYSQLLSNRGQASGSLEPYAWVLDGGADFPPEAHPGDWGFDAETGDLYRNEA